MSKARITQAMRDTGIKFIRVKSGDDSQAGKVGIHLLLPTQRELENAVERAERDLFPAIYIHGFSTWPIGRTVVRPEVQS